MFKPEPGFIIAGHRIPLAAANHGTALTLRAYERATFYWLQTFKLLHVGEGPWLDRTVHGQYECVQIRVGRCSAFNENNMEWDIEWHKITDTFRRCRSMCSHKWAVHNVSLSVACLTACMRPMLAHVTIKQSNSDASSLMGWEVIVYKKIKQRFPSMHDKCHFYYHTLTLFALKSLDQKAICTTNQLIFLIYINYYFTNVCYFFSLNKL